MGRYHSVSNFRAWLGLFSAMRILRPMKIGFPVLMSVLKEERDDVEMVAVYLFFASLFIEELNLALGLLDVLGALESLVSALTPLDHANGSRDEEAILSIPHGITRLMDIPMDCENPKNIDAIACKLLGDNVQEPALNSILRITLRTSSTQEYFAVDYVFKCFCEKNSDGQTMLASTLIPQPQSMIHAPLEEDVNMSFGSMLLRSLTLSENNGDLEVITTISATMPSFGDPEPLMHRMVKYLAVASSMKNRNGKLRQGLRLLAEAREEALKESETEVNDLHNKARLLEFGEDVDKLLEGIGDDLGLPNDDEDDGDET
ncbi:Golgin candidate 6, partial [Cucurbita argyrosperma subsp. argyrosperma]